MCGVNSSEYAILLLWETYLVFAECHAPSTLKTIYNNYHKVFFICDTGIDYPSAAHEFIPNFSGVRVVRFFSFLCNVLWIFVCPFVLFLLAIALSLILWFMASYDTFVIFKLFVKWELSNKQYLFIRSKPHSEAFIKSNILHSMY
jgi:hypothetical protein